MHIPGHAEFDTRKKTKKPHKVEEEGLDGGLKPIAEKEAEDDLLDELDIAYESSLSPTVEEAEPLAEPEPGPDDPFDDLFEEMDSSPVLMETQGDIPSKPTEYALADPRGEEPVASYEGEPASAAEPENLNAQVSLYSEEEEDRDSPWKWMILAFAVIIVLVLLLVFVFFGIDAINNMIERFTEKLNALSSGSFFTKQG